MVLNMNLLQTILDCGCGATVRIVPTTIANIKTQTCDFDLPPELEASEPPEMRGLARDEVRLMVSSSTDNRVVLPLTVVDNSDNPPTRLTAR